MCQRLTNLKPKMERKGCDAEEWCDISTLVQVGGKAKSSIGLSWLKSSMSGFCFHCGIVLWICDSCWKGHEGSVCVCYTSVCVLNLRPTDIQAASLLWNLLFWKHVMWCFCNGKSNCLIYIFFYIYIHMLKRFFVCFVFVWCAAKIFLFNERVQNHS